MIDAESAYQGKYPAASTYMARLRKLIGNGFPVGLAGFPYVDYHLSFPYSVFLGPNGAQYNLPQMYWADIGTTVSAVFSHTYEYNEIYRRPIFPLGQLFGRLSAAAIEQFNTLASDYGATGVSWWDWQSASLSFFSDIDKLERPALRLQAEPHGGDDLPRQQGRSGDLGPGAPRRRGLQARDRRRVRAGDAERRQGIPDQATSADHRNGQRRHLERAGQGHAA